MKKIQFLFFILILGSGIAAAQNVFYPTYNLQKDKPWIDSLKHIAKKGFIQNSYEKNNWKKQLTFVNACVDLGRYYEMLFDKKKLPDLKQALVYYNKVADMERFPDDPRYFKALAIRTTLFRKLSVIYFKGVGVKRNRKLSLQYALMGIAGNPELFRLYSKRYFNCDCIVLNNPRKYNYEIDTIFTLGPINPFAIRANLFKPKMVDKDLTILGNAFKVRVKKEHIQILVQVYPEPSARSQFFAHRLIENIKSFWVNRMQIDPNKIVTNTDIGNGDKNLVDILFIKEGAF